ncbi:MAG: hypothetical protein ACLQDV_25295 [Candidatus Binataceae bacterium]
MRPKIQVYLTEDELADVRRAARRRRVTVSRYAKERLIPFPLQDDEPHESSVNAKHIVDAARSAAATGNRPTQEQLRTLIVMFDQFALSAFMHLPEIPEAQNERARAIAQRRHQAWQAAVEEMIRRLRDDDVDQGPAASRNGASA